MSGTPPLGPAALTRVILTTPPARRLRTLLTLAVAVAAVLALAASPARAQVPVPCPNADQLLGTVGIAAVGTLFGAMTAHVRARELLFPVLLLPVLVPVLLGIVQSTEALLLGDSLGSVAHWLKLVATADVIYVVAGLLTFDVLLEG